MAAACFAPPPEIADGFTAEDYETDPVEVWPDCWASWRLFNEIAGQWRTSGMGGVIALDYVPLFMRMEKLGLSQEQWNDKFHDIRVIEAAAIDAMNTKP